MDTLKQYKGRFQIVDEYLENLEKTKQEREIKLIKNGIIEFSQINILHNVESTSKKLHALNLKYNGLCEIISNYVLLEDLLGEQYPLPLQSDVIANCSKIENGEEQLRIKFKNRYKDKLTLENLKKVENTHILNVTSFITQLIAALFYVYPCNLFANGPFAKSPYYSSSDNRLYKSNIQVDRQILDERFSQLEVGFYIKYFVVQKQGTFLKGHSMLIKKMSTNTYSFFDPNHGEHMNLTISQLADKINKSAEVHKAKHMVFLDAKEFVKSYQISKPENEVERLDNSPKL